jgi:hypothetical protein
MGGGCQNKKTKKCVFVMYDVFYTVDRYFIVILSFVGVKDTRIRFTSLTDHTSTFLSAANFAYVCDRKYNRRGRSEPYELEDFPSY